jgi:hypothetical protein
MDERFNPGVAGGGRAGAGCVSREHGRPLSSLFAERLPSPRQALKLARVLNVTS